MKSLSLLKEPAGHALQGMLSLGDRMGGRWDWLVRSPLHAPALVVEWLCDLGGDPLRALSSARSLCLEGLPVGKGGREEGSDVDSGQPAVQSAASLLLTPYMTLGKVLSLSEPQFLHL